MALISPGVEVIEIDASLRVPNTATSFGAFVGKFPQGPADIPVLFTNVTDLTDTLGEPTLTNANDAFQPINFLRYQSGNIYVVRAIDSDGMDNRTANPVQVGSATAGDTTLSVTNTNTLWVNASIQIGANPTIYTVSALTSNQITITPALAATISGGEDIFTLHPSNNALIEAPKTGQTVDATDLREGFVVIPNAVVYDTLESTIPFTSSTNTKLKFIAKNPGAWGNNLKVSIAKPSDFGVTPANQAITGIVLDDLFEVNPSTGENEIAIVVSLNNRVVEQFIVSLNPTQRDFNNRSTYIETVINDRSRYIFVKDNTGLNTFPADLPDSALADDALTLQDGNDGAPSATDITNGYNNTDLANKERLDIDIVIANELVPTEVASFCSLRADVIGVIGATFGDTVGKRANVATSNLVTYATTGTLNISNNFVSFFGNYLKIKDNYNDRAIWVNIAGSVAGIIARTIQNQDPWFAAAGLNRGQLLDVVDLAFNPNQGQRDILYKNAINPIVQFPGQGTVLWGQKTKTARPSSFDRINVRMLFNFLERRVANAAKFVVFDQNDATTRNLFLSAVTPLFQRVQARRGINEFRIVCDETNNTPEVLQNNQFVAEFFIKPTTVAEFITLRFVNVGQTVEFSTVIGQV